MAIEAYVGLPGHGKSYGVVEHVVLPSIIEGRHVVTNIPLERDDILADHGVPGSDISQLPEDWFERPDMADFIPAGSVLILDELWRRWPSGLKANQALLADKALLAEHRHRVDEKGRSMRIVLVTQDLAQLASWVRILVEQTYKMTKLTAIGSSKKYRVDIYLGAPTGQNIPKSKLIRQTFGQYNKLVYRYYSSATQSATGNVGDESKADKRGVIWRSPFIIFSIVGPILGIPLLLWYVSGVFAGGFGMAEPSHPLEPEVQVVNPPPVPTVSTSTVVHVPVPSAPPSPAFSSIWRVSGYLQRGNDNAAAEGAWDSRLGYGRQPETDESKSKLVDMVLLHSEIHGNRRMPASECSRISDGINWQCEVDGAIATPWTGRGDSTNWAADTQTLTARTATVVRASGDDLTNPAP